LPHELFVLIEGEFSTGGKVGSQVDELGGCVLARGKEQVLERIGQRQDFVLLHCY
jgi:hypothetical protein